jgi:hypothetical protein
MVSGRRIKSLGACPKREPRRVDWMCNRWHFLHLGECASRLLVIVPFEVKDLGLIDENLDDRAARGSHE